MNFEKVLELVKVYSKTRRALRNEKLRKYTENKTLTYLFYGGALVAGFLIGIFGGLFASDAGLHALILGYFPVIPTTLFLIALFFSISGKTSRMQEETNAEISPWLPITWEEHTLASLLVNFTGVPLAILLLACSGAISFAFVFGEFAMGAIALISIIIAVFMASLLVEIFSTLMERLFDRLSASSGRAGIWVRFIGMIGVGLAFFFFWFVISQGGGAFLRSFSEIQWKIWFVPSVWPGVALAFFAGGNYALFLVLLISTGIFEFGLFHLSTRLNMRFGGRESTSFTIGEGDYSYGGGILEKFGFPPLEASLISKDFRAFTRNKKLMGVLFAPLFFMLWPLLQGPKSTIALPLMAPAIVSMTLGSVSLGSEGRAVWHLYSMPITAERLLRCKYYFVVICSGLLSSVGYVSFVWFFRPSPVLFIVLLVISIILVLTLPLIVLKGGISGAEFTESPDPKMVETSTNILYSGLMIVIELIILSPLIYLFLNPNVSLSGIVVPAVLSFSVGVGYIFGYIFYRLDLAEVERFLEEAEI